MRIRNWSTIAFGVCTLIAASTAQAAPLDPATLITDNALQGTALTYTPDVPANFSTDFATGAGSAGVAQGTLLLADAGDGSDAVTAVHSVDTALAPITSTVNEGLDSLGHALSAGASKVSTALSNSRAVQNLPSMPNLPNVTGVLDPVTSALSQGVSDLPNLPGVVTTGALLAPLTNALNSSANSLSNATASNSASPFSPLTNLLGGMFGGAQSK